MKLSDLISSSRGPTEAFHTPGRGQKTPIPGRRSNVPQSLKNTPQTLQLVYETVCTCSFSPIQHQHHQIGEFYRRICWKVENQSFLQAAASYSIKIPQFFNIYWLCLPLPVPFPYTCMTLNVQCIIILFCLSESIAHRPISQGGESSARSYPPGSLG